MFKSPGIRFYTPKGLILSGIWARRSRHATARYSAHFSQKQQQWPQMFVWKKTLLTVQTATLLPGVLFVLKWTLLNVLFVGFFCCIHGGNRTWREGCQAHVLVQLLLGTNKSCHHAFGSTSLHAKFTGAGVICYQFHCYTRFATPTLLQFVTATSSTATMRGAIE